MKIVLSKETFTFLGIVQDVPHIFATNVVILVRRLLNFLTNDLIITGFVRVAQNPLYTLSLLKKILKKGAKYFLKLLKKKIKKIEEDNTSIFWSLETIVKNMEDRNITIRSKLDKLEDRIDSCEKQIFIQQSSTNKSDENQMLDSESANNNTQEPLMLMNQLKDWQSRPNNIIAYNIPESELVNNDDIAADELRKFQQSIAKQCNVEIGDNSVLKLYRLGKKQELSSKPRPLVATFPNSYLRNKLIKTAFKLKHTPYSISIDRTVEERNLYKKVLNERTKCKIMTTGGNGNTRSEALHGIQKLSRSKFEHNKKVIRV